MKKITPIIMLLFITLLFASPVSAKPINGDGDGDNPYLDKLHNQSEVFAKTIVTGIAVAFGVGFLINLVRAQLARGTGDQLGYSRALQQGISMVILLALAANVTPIAKALQEIGSGANFAPGLPDTVTGVWKELAGFFVTTILGGVGVYTTVSAMGSGLAGTLAIITGSPTGVSRVISNAIILVGGGLLTILAVLFANSMLETVF